MFFSFFVLIDQYIYWATYIMSKVFLKVSYVPFIYGINYVFSFVS